MAQKQPMTEERLRQQLEKTGDTQFVFEELLIRMEAEIFLPVKALNQLRREAFARLSQALCRPYFRAAHPPVAIRRAKAARRQEPGFLTASCETREQVKAAFNAPEISRLYLPISLAEQCLEDGRASGKEIFLSLPHAVRADTLAGWEGRVEKLFSLGLSGFLVRNLEGFAWLRERGLEKKSFLDASLYTWNEETLAFWEEQGVLGDTAPLEFNERELKHRSCGRSEMVVYGRLPLMVSAQCVRKNLEGCTKNSGTVHLRDRYRKEFPVQCFCDSCYNVIYNSVPLGLLAEAGRVWALGVPSVRLAFTVEEEKETLRVIREFAGAYLFGRPVQSRSNCTKGHFKRGVE